MIARSARFKKIPILRAIPIAKTIRLFQIIIKVQKETLYKTLYKKVSIKLTNFINTKRKREDDKYVDSVIRKKRISR